jgi:hypothetical protein
VVDCIGLENRRTARFREFESHLFRQSPNQIERFGAFFVSVAGAKPGSAQIPDCVKAGCHHLK